MLKRYFITFTLFLISFCLQAQISVIINNQSGIDRHIQVTYPANFKLPVNENEKTNDSLRTYDHRLTENAISTRDYYRYPSKTPILSLDTVARTYSFNLKAKHEVIVEFRNNATKPTFGQVFKIDNSETIELKRNGKFFKKAPKLLPASSWTYTITDSKH